MRHARPRRGDTLDLCLPLCYTSYMDIQEIAKLLGQRGGQARAKNLTASRRKEIASNASRKRWGNLTAKHTPEEVQGIIIGHCKFCGWPDYYCKRRKRDHTFTPYQG